MLNCPPSMVRNLGGIKEEQTGKGGQRQTQEQQSITNKANDAMDEVDPLANEVTEVSASSPDPRERVRELLMAKTDLKEICKAVGFTSAYIYQVRRDMISELLEGNIGVEVISEMLGCGSDIVKRLKKGRDKLRRTRTRSDTSGLPEERYVEIRKEMIFS